MHVNWHDRVSPLSLHVWVSDVALLSVMFILVAGPYLRPRPPTLPTPVHLWNRYQNQFPNPVPRKFSKKGVHGSKFTTVVVTGDQEQSIAPLAYQATTQAMHLMRGSSSQPLSRLSGRVVSVLVSVFLYLCFFVYIHASRTLSLCPPFLQT